MLDELAPIPERRHAPGRFDLRHDRRRTRGNRNSPGQARPPALKSFAIAFVDTTILTATPTNAQGFHSVIWDIAANVSMLPQALPSGSPPAGIAGLESAKQKNPLGPRYLGPCPNAATAHTYEFRLYALSQATLPGITAQTSTQQIINAVAGSSPLGMAVLRGTSNASGQLK